MNGDKKGRQNDRKNKRKKNCTKIKGKNEKLTANNIGLSIFFFIVVKSKGMKSTKV